MPTVIYTLIEPSEILTCIALLPARARTLMPNVDRQKETLRFRNQCAAFAGSAQFPSEIFVLDPSLIRNPYVSASYRTIAAS